MTIDGLTLDGFRSYDRSSFSFKEGVNIVWGENARGKTNMLEGIMLLSGSTSWRSRKRGDLINFYRARASIEGRISARSRTFDVKISMPLNGKTSYSVNGVSIKKQHDLSEYLKCVLFCPDDLYLVKGEPEKRRRFMDTALCQLRPRYAACLSEYNQLLKLKQLMLKEGEDKRMLPVVNERLIYYGAELIHYRNAFLTELTREAEIIHRGISRGAERLELRYKTVSTIEDPSMSTDMLRDRLSKHMDSHMEAELKTGSMLSGAHKDDIEILINGQSARSFASQGQTRTAALALKFGERELFRIDSGEWPILLLDDVLSELDESRSTFVASSAVGGQTIITCCTPPTIFNEANIISI